MHDEPFGSPPVDEAQFDSYVVRDRPIVDFLHDTARRAPWWTVSFLVHLLVMVVLWRWPVSASVVVDPITIGPLGIWDPPPREVEPPVPPDLPDPEKQEPPEPEETDLYVDDTMPNTNTEYDEPPPRNPIETTLDPIDCITMPPIFVIDAPNGRPMPERGLFGPRDDFYRGTRGGRDGRGTKIGRVGVGEIMSGLRWLARAQGRDGSWNAQAWGGNKPYTVGMTGLAMLAFHGAGFTEKRGPFQATIKRGLRWLRTQQRPDGSFPWETYYEQGIATMAVVEANALSRDPAIERMAQRAINYVCKTQPEHGGFRYTGAVPRGEGDMSVTGWQIMAIKSALCTPGIEVPDEAVERSQTFLRNASRKYGTSAYIVASAAPGSPAVTSVGMLCRIFLSGEDDVFGDEINAAATTLLARETDGGEPIYGGKTKELTKDLYYTYYSALAMYQAGEEYWRIWSKSYYGPLRTAIVRRERDADGRYVKGSWDPARYRWAKNGGRVYSTAMAVLSLEVPFRYLRVYRARR